MASPDPAEESSDVDGGGVLERTGTQLAALASQVSEIDERMTSVESGSPSQPVEVKLSPETVAQIADALAALQAAGSQALDDAFKSASDDLTDALSGLVQAEVSRTLADAGYTVEVTEAAEPDVDVEPDEAAAPLVDSPLVDSPVAEAQIEEFLPTEPAADDPETASAAIPPIAAPLAVSPVAPEAAEIDEDGVDDGEAESDADRPPLSLDELDDPFLDALIRKEPLSA